MRTTPAAVVSAASVLLLAVASLSCEGPEGPEGAGLGSMDDPAVQPKVIYTYPPPYSVGPYPGLETQPCDEYPCFRLSPLTLRFNKFMEPASVRNSIRISSSSGMVRADPDYIGSSGGDEFFISPVGDRGYPLSWPYPVGEVCTLTVGGEARDVNGNTLGAPYSFTFVPEPEFRVRAVLPPDGASDSPALSSRPVLFFNSQVDSSILHHLSVSPPLPGPWYIGNRSIEYSGPPPSNSTTYVIRLAAGAADAAGHSLRTPFASTFGTNMFDVEAMAFVFNPYEPWNPPGEKYLWVRPVISFTGTVDSASLAAAVSISPDAEYTIVAEGYGVGYGNSFFIIPTRGWKMSTDYVIRVDSTLRSTGGSMLPRTYAMEFRTQEFQVISPTDSLTIYPNENIRVAMNAPLDSASVLGAITIEPPVEFGVWIYRTDFWIEAPGGFDYGERYTVRIDTTLRTALGEALPEAHVFTFDVSY